MKRFLPFLLIASICASTALATTYVRVEKDGTKTYSDRPIPGGVAIDLEPAQGYSTPSPQSPSLRLSPGQAQYPENFRYQSCPVTPPNDSTFTNPESVPISVAPDPALRPSDTVALTVDGQAVGPAGTTSHTLTQVPRGTHTVAVTITSPEGKVVCSSTSVFHVMRPGLNSPVNRPRPTPH